MRRLLCWLGFHRYSWAMFNHTCELWVCGCGRVVMQFSDDPLAMSEVEQMNEWLKKPSAKVNR
jgi:hypothetical protein